MKVPIPLECSQKTDGQKIVCAEKGRKITFLNPNRRKVTRYTIDACKELRDSPGQRTRKLCDFLVVDWRCEEHYVELKGKNVEHALRQLESTIPQFRGAGCVYCWIITTESPGTLPRFMVLKEKFKKKFNAQLTIRTNQCEYKLE